MICIPGYAKGSHRFRNDRIPETSCNLILYDRTNFIGFFFSLLQSPILRQVSSNSSSSGLQSFQTVSPRFIRRICNQRNVTCLLVANLTGAMNKFSWRIFKFTQAVALVIFLIWVGLGSYLRWGHLGRVCAGYYLDDSHLLNMEKPYLAFNGYWCSQLTMIGLVVFLPIIIILAVTSSKAMLIEHWEIYTNT